MTCTLCTSTTVPFYYLDVENRHYHRCTHCHAVLMDPDDFPSPEEEINRYQSHNNNVDDPRYQKFVFPLVHKVTQLFKTQSLGLDYGSGTGPVIAKMLTKLDYRVNTYDPFFDNNLEVLNNSYDYIVSCEVIEHFHHPEKEFRKLRNMLNPNGALILKTDIFTEDIDFGAWYYKNDETHVFFYHPDTLEWIKLNYHFSSLEIDGRHITFQT